jgi:hypothetical protein
MLIKKSAKEAAAALAARCTAQELVHSASNSNLDTSSSSLEVTVCSPIGHTAI